NRELRSRVAEQENFDGLSFDQLVRMLRADRIEPSFWTQSRVALIAATLPSSISSELPDVAACIEKLQHSGHVFEMFSCLLSLGDVDPDPHGLGKLMASLASWNLVESKKLLRNVSPQMQIQKIVYKLSPMGRLFKNRLSLFGDLDTRKRLLWQTESDPQP